MNISFGYFNLMKRIATQSTLYSRAGEKFLFDPLPRQIDETHQTKMPGGNKNFLNPTSRLPEKKRDFPALDQPFFLKFQNLSDQTTHRKSKTHFGKPTTRSFQKKKENTETFNL